MNQTPDQDQATGKDRTPAQKRSIRRTALILAAIALAFYLGFIAIGVLRA